MPTDVGAAAYQQNLCCQRIPTSTEDDTMIHTIQPETFLRHHAQEITRTVERNRRRRDAVRRTPRGPRTNATVGA